MVVKGIIRYMDINMGFWAFEGADGSRFELIDLPKSHQKDGLECLLELSTLDVASINMWGKPARVKAVK